MTKTSLVIFTCTSAVILALSACQPTIEGAPPRSPEEARSIPPPITSLTASVPDEVDQYGTPDEDAVSKVAHVHGQAELAVIIEDDRLSVTFDSPLVNLIGFEQEPRTDADWALIDALQDQFLSDDALVDLPTKARCDVISISSGLRFKGEHGSLMVEQDFACEKASRLQGAEVMVFSRFKDIQQLDVYVLGDSPQTTTVMTADKADLALEF